MVEHMANQHALLAVLGEFRPVVGNRQFGIDQALVDQAIEGDAGNALGHRHHAENRILLPWQRLRLVTETAPEIDDLDAIDIGADGRADFVFDSKVFRERVRYPGEGIFDPALKVVIMATRMDCLVELHRRLLLPLLSKP